MRKRPPLPATPYPPDTLARSWLAARMALFVQRGQLLDLVLDLWAGCLAAPGDGKVRPH